MGLINYTKVYGAKVRALLADGERLLVVGPYRRAFGDQSGLALPADAQNPLLRKLGELAAEQPPREPSQRAITGFDPLWGIEWNESVHAKVNRGIAGFSASGGANSVAALVVAATDGLAGLYYAVTDRRLLVLELTGRRELRIVVGLPREVIAEARRQGLIRLVPQRGRVLLTFADTSQLALLTELLLTGHARALVAALA